MIFNCFLFKTSRKNPEKYLLLYLRTFFCNKTSKTEILAHFPGSNKWKINNLNLGEGRHPCLNYLLFCFLHLATVARYYLDALAGRVNTIASGVTMLEGH